LSVAQWHPNDSLLKSANGWFGGIPAVQNQFYRATATTAFGTLPTDRRRSLILDLVAKYTYKILSANVGFVGKLDVSKMATDAPDFVKTNFPPLTMRCCVNETKD
jgi:hypothetical protein